MSGIVKTFKDADKYGILCFGTDGNVDGEKSGILIFDDKRGFDGRGE